MKQKISDLWLLYEQNMCANNVFDSSCQMFIQESNFDPCTIWKLRR